MPTTFDLPHAEPRLVSVTRDRLYVVAVIDGRSGENLARYRYIHGGGERDHFPVSGVALLELGHDGTEHARWMDMLVHRVVKGAVGVFWHGPPQAGVSTALVGAHGWELSSGRKIWSFPRGLVALGEQWALGRAGEKARGAADRLRYVVFDVVTGAPRVELEGGELVAMITDDERAYVLDRGASLSAYRLADGAHLWTSAFDEEKRPTLTSYGLALGDGCLWYAARQGAVGLDPGTGAVAVEHPMREYFDAVVAGARGAVTIRETKIDVVTRSAATRMADVYMSDRTTSSNGCWLIGTAKVARKETKDLLVVPPDGPLALFKLATPATSVALGEEHLALHCGASRFAVVALAELGDTKAKTLASCDGVVLAKRAALPKLAASAAATRLADALTNEGLLPEMGKAERTRRLLDLFGRDPLPDAAAALLLQASYEDDNASLARGFLCHDWRFGHETDDIIAEFDRALAGGPIRLEQVRNDHAGLTMRVCHGAAVEEVAFGTDVSLLDIALRIDAALAKAASPKRIHVLETDGDWYAFLIVGGDVVARLRAAKVSGIGLSA